MSPPTSNLELLVPPQIVVVAGPNGAGKSTLARLLLPEAMLFLNADEIAKALPDAVEGVQRDFEAGRELLRRMDALIARRQGFAVETTLSSRTLAPKIERLRREGYEFHLLFLWLPGPEMAMARVSERVRRGGHDIPETTIRRRYEAGLRNLSLLYLPLADRWRVYQNVATTGPELVAEGGKAIELTVHNPIAWAKIQARGNENADDRQA